MNSESDVSPPAAMRRVWFPPLWIALLSIACVVATMRNEDLGRVYFVYQITTVMGIVGLAVWVVRSSGWAARVRWPLAVIPCLTLLAFYTHLLPVEAVFDGNSGIVAWRWRWAEPDQHLAVPEGAASATPLWKHAEHDFPAFLGGRPWPEVDNVCLADDWSARPPRKLWRQPIGAGWSGFAVVGAYAVTQEQRGNSEMTVCYEVETGKVAWRHIDRGRWDPTGPGALGGIGPRATPAVHDGRVFVHSPTGMVNCLDAQTGNVIWSHDTLEEFDAKNVMWGKSCSPLIVDDMVVVSVGGTKDQSLVAFDQQSGDVVWTGGKRRSSYATPALMTLGDSRQIVCVNEARITAHNVAGGRVLWEHPWRNRSDSRAAASQPVQVGQNRVWLSMGYGVGAELIEVSQADENWEAKRVWKRPVLKTKMTNIVVRDGYAYGISDGQIFQCVEINSGKPVWRQRRSPTFGHGQILLVGDAILILSESGEVIMIAAWPESYEEIGAFQALEGVTWNNPALAGSKLLVRNAEEAACYELPIIVEVDAGNAEL